MKQFSQGKWKIAEYVPEGVTINGKEYIIFNEGENHDYERTDIALARHEEDARLIAAAPGMFNLILSLLYAEYLNDTPRYSFLSFARNIVEFVLHLKIDWDAAQHDLNVLKSKGGET